MNLAPILIAVILLASSAAAAITAATQTFQSNYMETLCRMENVRTRALENLERDEPLVVDFGGDECLSPTWTPAPTLSPTPSPTPEPTS